MAQGPYDVTTIVVTHLVLPDSGTTDVVVELGYRSSDPYAVQARFMQEGSPASTWLLARDLLAQGLVATEAAPAGAGTACLWRDEDPDYLLMVLQGADGEALLAAPAESIERFLQATRALVPFGAESDLVEPAVDALIAMLLVP